MKTLLEGKLSGMINSVNQQNTKMNKVKSKGQSTRDSSGKKAMESQEL
jgi:hypothetical protein